MKRFVISLLSAILLVGITDSRVARPFDLFEENDYPQEDVEIEEVLTSSTELEPRVHTLQKEDIETSTREIRRQIEEINERLTQQDKDTILQDAKAEDPEGYDCENTIIEVKELKYVDQVRCFNTSEEICSMVHTTVFEEKEEKRCDTHFRKVCWIDYEDQAKTEAIRICNKKPERVCNLSKVELATRKVMKECKDHYETVCQTSYIQKEVAEDRVICDTQMTKMCMTIEDEETCVDIPKKICKTTEIKKLKAIPQTKCEQHKRQLCTDPVCPLVVENEVCQDIEKTYVQRVPKESCELEPREVCKSVHLQYPSLKMESVCDLLPRETCTPERVQPTLVTRPVIKKLCSKRENNQGGDDEEKNGEDTDSKKEYQGCENSDESGRYQIKTFLNGREITLQCYDKKTVIQNRVGTENPLYFDRTFDEYSKGFGDIDESGSDFMLGLDDIHILTTEKGLTNLEMVVYGETIKFSNFKIQSAEKSFEIESIEPWKEYIGTKFTTKDTGRECALKHTGGWWFPPNHPIQPCGIVNLNGILQRNNKDNFPDSKNAFLKKGDGSTSYLNQSTMLLSLPASS